MSVLVPSRSKMKNSLHHRVDAELNLIPLIDILSVMVAFLLVYSTNVEVVQNAKGIAIPQSSSESQPKQSVVVMVTKDQVFVQGELVANVQEIRDSTDSSVAPLRAVLERPMLVNERSGGEGRMARVAGDHRACRQIPALRGAEESDVDLHGGRLRQDFTGRHREGATGSRRRAGNGIAATHPCASHSNSQGM